MIAWPGLLRDRAKDPVTAKGVITSMVTANPKSGRAHLVRWKYQIQSGEKADDQDIAAALKLAPDDPEVLITAAGLALRAKKSAEARTLIERGLKLHPKNSTFYVLASSLELQEAHPDRAEAVIREGVKAIPSDAQLAFLLTDLLISQNKLGGEDGAEAWIVRLRQRRLTDGAIAYLEARLPLVRKQWKEAIPKLETARSLLASDAELTGKLNLMLAECYARTGDSPARLAALRRAAEFGDEPTAVAARRELGPIQEAAGLLEDARTQYAILARDEPRGATRSRPGGDRRGSSLATDQAELARGGTASQGGRAGPAADQRGIGPGQSRAAGRPAAAHASSAVA